MPDSPLGQSRMSPDASHVTAWRTARQESKLEYVAQRTALAEHFEAMAVLLEQMGHAPFGQLELRMPGYAFDSQVIFRWERPMRRRESVGAEPEHTPRGRSGGSA